MRIYIMRHGEAQTFAASDEERLLTERGEQQSVEMARWLANELPEGKLDLVLVSPYLRAQQTWNACQTVLPTAQKVLTEDGITPYGDSEHVASYLRALVTVDHPASILLVSHLPLVGYLTAEFAVDMQAPMFPTSSIACIELDAVSEKSDVRWLKSPSQLMGYA
ncbi:phosphohistidine phosphatase SixA [Enterovibrio norvegicus FF-33]|uniref:phosphohistidine phosphatase SixA n=1 Tax=Enterovibrio norvegicus TaxID=188144 RepID=UPI00037D402E|nr:phosphohistidine phosphatase SixA [Enterovibrio norvegicus]OEE68132.1 phosphohistidine phosphatase SixA [Enterovibrio norvegicus FF-33]